MNHAAGLLLPILLLMSACGGGYTPKPRGYFRIDLPPKEYRPLESDCPFTFDYPVYAEIVAGADFFKEPCWMNIHFPAFKGDLHVSYKAVDGNLHEYIEDAYRFKMKHMAKATAFSDSLVDDRKRRVYGQLYGIKGNEAASPCQFFLTDSTSHFVRMSLYFRVVPNNDSLAPVIDFIRKDIARLIRSFRWKDDAAKEKRPSGKGQTIRK